jgi:hypothetical protein
MKYHVKIECAGQCDFKHEWTGEALNSQDAKSMFIASMGDPYDYGAGAKKHKQHLKHMGHKDTKICERVK